MRIAVCEDDQTSRDFEKGLIQQWAEKKQIKITVDSYSSAENFLFESEDKSTYDFLILDIQMGKMNGFELAKKLRQNGYAGALAFLTGITDYAIEGYEVGAIRYILKPVKEQNLFQVLDAVYTDLEKKEKEVFILQIGSDVSKIPFANIIYVEADGHYVHLKGYDDKNQFFEKAWKAVFSKVSTEFDNKGYFCLRRGLLVNLQHIRRITKTECIMSNGEVLPVARNNYDDLNRAFIEFYREKSL